MSLINELTTLKNEKNFIFEIETKKKITYKSLINKIKKNKNFLDIKIKSNVVSILPNSIHYIESMIGTIQNEHVFCPVPYFTNTVEIEKIFRFLKPNVIITDRTDIKKIIKTKFISKGRFFFIRKKLINQSKLIKKIQQRYIIVLAQLVTLKQ